MGKKNKRYQSNVLIWNTYEKIKNIFFVSNKIDLIKSIWDFKYLFLSNK